MVVVVSVVVVVVVVVVVPVSVGPLDAAAAGAAAAGEPSSSPRPLARSVRAWTVSGAFGLNVRTLLAPMSPCATTVLICGFAQFGALEDELGGRAGGDGREEGGGDPGRRECGELPAHTVLIGRSRRGH